MASTDVNPADDQAPNLVHPYEAALAQMKANTIQALRAELYGPGWPEDEQPLRVDVQPASGQLVSCFTGDNGVGLINDAARLMANRLNRINTDDTVTYTAEQHGNPDLPKAWAVMGRRVAEPDSGYSAENDGEGRDVDQTAAESMRLGRSNRDNSDQEYDNSPGANSGLNEMNGSLRSGELERFDDGARYLKQRGREQMQSVYGKNWDANEIAFREKTRDKGNATGLALKLDRNLNASPPAQSISTLQGDMSVPSDAFGVPLKLDQTKPLTFDLSSANATERGHAYDDDSIVKWSHYKDPVDSSNGRPAGNSRIWGDAPPTTQKAAIEALVNSSQEAGLNSRDTALVLAIARTESGFNPDAAAGTTSASGLGQFLNGTGSAYGLTKANRWAIGAQADAFVQHFLENKALAKRRGQGEEYIYKYHHDGSSADSGGLAISNQVVMPLVNKYEAILKRGY